VRATRPELDEAGDEVIAAVVIDYPDRGFVVPASEVTAVRSEATPSVPGVALGPLLGARDPISSTGCSLVVRHAGAYVEFRTAGSVRVERVARHGLCRLPRLLREAGCPSWVRGVDTGSQRLWISLLQLAETAETPP
jgi:hypothetical protein